MKKAKYVKVKATGKFYELECELFGRVYLKNGLEFHTEDVMFYTKKQYTKEQMVNIKAH